MDSFDIKEFIKKPVVVVVAVIFVLVLLFSVLFGGGEGQDPTAKAVKNLSNRHQALISLIDTYSTSVKSSNLRSSLSQASIILTADKNDIDIYFASLSKENRKVAASFSAKPDKDLIAEIDQAKISNNLDSTLKIKVGSELETLQGAIEKLKMDNLSKEKIVALADKLTLNTQTVMTRVEEAR